MWLNKKDFENLLLRLEVLEREISSYQICTKCGILAHNLTMKSSVAFCLGSSCNVERLCRKCQEEK